MVDKYYFILPDGSDRELTVDLVEDINWTLVYRMLYRYKLEHNIDMFDGSLENVLELIDVLI